MNRVKVDGLTFHSAAAASKWLGFERSYLCQALKNGKFTVVDKAGKVHKVSYLDRDVRICPCCGQAVL